MTNRFATLIVFLALCAGTIGVRAANNAVVTFTASPNVVSNTYNGLITLQINGLTNGANAVLVQKFLDANTNGVIDSGDLLVQQFQLAVGQASVFTNISTVPYTPVTVTNFLPGDASPSTTTNEIVVPLNFQNGDFAQTLVGQYLYKVSSPSGQFAPVTNLFVVTNTFYSTLVTGAVVNASSSASIPNAIVLLCVAENGAVNVQAGTVANNAGLFSLRVPPGTNFFAGAKSNFVEDVTNEYILQAKTTNLYPITISLTPATEYISGRLINASNSNGLAGVSGMAVSTNNFLSFYFTDTNGYFSAPVVSSIWEAPVDPFAAEFQGCLAWPQGSQILDVSNKVVSITNALPPATAIFYGVVSNLSSGSTFPMPGVYVDATDNAGHQSIGITDSHGKYVVEALAGTNQWQLFIQSTNNPGLTNSYVVAPGIVQMSGLQTNQAVQQNFGLVIAFYTISGTVSDLNGNPISGVEMFATNSSDQAFNVWTADGNYSMNVSPGAWTVGIVPASLQALGYTNIPPTQTVQYGASGVNFTVEVCGEIQILTTNLPDAMAGQYYTASIQAESCQNIVLWTNTFGIMLTSLYDHTNVLYPAGTAIYSESKIVGYLETNIQFGLNDNYQPYYINCSGSTQVDGNVVYFLNLSATIGVTAPITNGTPLNFGSGSVPWIAAGTTQTAPPYTTVVNATQYPPYTQSGIAAGNGYSAAVGATITMPGGSGSNRVASLLLPFRSMPTPGNSALVGSSIPYTNQNNLVVWIGTNMGQYLISAYGPQSTNMDGLSLYPDGTSAATISGTPLSVGTNGGTFNFSVLAEDVSSNITVQPLSIFVFPATGLTSSSVQAGMMQSSNTFQMHLSGLTNQFNYTVLMSTNLPSTNWVPIYTANNPTTNSLIVPDTSATNASRFYRLQISQ